MASSPAAWESPQHGKSMENACLLLRTHKHSSSTGHDERTSRSGRWEQRMACHLFKQESNYKMYLSSTPSLLWFTLMVLSVNGLRQTSEIPEPTARRMRVSIARFATFLMRTFFALLSSPATRSVVICWELT